MMLKLLGTFLFLIYFGNATKVKLLCKDKSSSCDGVKDKCDEDLYRLLCRKTCGYCKCEDLGISEICDSQDICSSSEGRLLCQNKCDACEFSIIPSSISFGKFNLGNSKTNNQNESSSQSKPSDTNGDTSNNQTSSSSTDEKNKSSESSELSDECVKAHNQKRSKHKETPSLEWDSELAKSAEQWATKISGMNSLQHSQGDSVGENLYMTSDTGLKSPCETATEKWYAEIKDFNFNNPEGRGGKPTGHFTQVVWKGSTKLGCGVGKGRGLYVVCQYKEAGNMMRSYKDNVMPLG